MSFKHTMEQREQTLRLRGEGLSAPAIGRRLGISPSTIRDWWGGTRCPGCGKPITSSAALCTPCHQRESRLWTPERIIRAIQQFHRMYRRPPTVADWNPALARRRGKFEVAARYERDGCWPSDWSVRKRFGSWNAAIRAAGLQPRKGGAHT